MSYCRFAENGSDVYMFEGPGGIVCCGCRLASISVIFKTPLDAMLHLFDHIKAGHKVIPRAFEGLLLHIEENKEPK